MVIHVVHMTLNIQATRSPCMQGHSTNVHARPLGQHACKATRLTCLQDHLSTVHAKSLRHCACKTTRPPCRQGHLAKMHRKLLGDAPSSQRPPPSPLCSEFSTPSPFDTVTMSSPSTKTAPTSFGRRLRQPKPPHVEF
uniref:Uncharacterized protein n=1 Tax=Cannabis sativa TaxID=3483 RepID=A0A803P0H6_CANSA